jgi:ectoine hydroxylase-related dioxygenase (phytanoyl-CoA dioxygenase family)
MPGKNTLFETLWIDDPHAPSVLARKKEQGQLDDDLAGKLSHLIEFGWVAIPKAINKKLADRIAIQIDDVVSRPEFYIARRARAAYSHPDTGVLKDPSFRLIDFHVNSELARQAIFSSSIVRILAACFDDPINAFQCLTFRYGSQQALHQDGAYVVVSKPLKFLASWIALEDITPGSGELTYYSGSHKLDDFLFPGNSKCWIPKVHGEELHKAFLDSIVQKSIAANLPLDTFLPKKGDALIWASDLVHGGSRITNQKTRRSLVTHYCPKSVNPNFKKFSGHYYLQSVNDNCLFSSRHYDLRIEPEQNKTSWRNRLLGKPRFEPGLRKPAFMG